MIQNMGFGVLPSYKFTILPNYTFTLIKWNEISLGFMSFMIENKEIFWVILPPSEGQKAIIDIFDLNNQMKKIAFIQDLFGFWLFFGGK